MFVYEKQSLGGGGDFVCSTPMEILRKPKGIFRIPEEVLGTPKDILRISCRNLKAILRKPAESQGKLREPIRKSRGVVRNSYGHLSNPDVILKKP